MKLKRESYFAVLQAQAKVVRLLFLRRWEVLVLPRFRHKTSIAEDARLNGSALALQAAFADINIAKRQVRLLNSLCGLVGNQMADPGEVIKSRMAEIRRLSNDKQGTTAWFEAANLALSVLHDTVGGSHPLMSGIRDALSKADYSRAVAATRAVITLYEGGGLTSPRLAIAHELEGDILEIAQQQVQRVEAATEPEVKTVHLGIAAFLAGAALEDGLRRLCDAHGLAYDAQRTSVAKLQALLYQPSSNIAVITASDNKQITAWGDVRNKADHGKLSQLTHSEVLAMVIGVRGFLDRHMP
jgi:hypothetical protein